MYPSVLPRFIYQALEDVGDVNVTAHESYSREDGRGGRRWMISFTGLGYPAHPGEIKVDFMVTVSLANVVGQR